MIPEPSGGFLNFPPGRPTVLVATSPARAAALGTTMYTAVKPGPAAVQRVVWALARAGLLRVVPGSRRPDWHDPAMPAADVLAELWPQWDAAAGGADGVAVYRRPQTHRTAPGLTMLVCAGPRSLLVRVRRDPTALALEAAVSRAGADLPLSHVHVPALAGSGETGGWHWIAQRSIATRPHRGVRRIGPPALAEVRALAERVVPRPPDVPRHWTGAHGDLVPWNLRRAGGRTWLIDWEDAAWAPPGLDRVYLAAVSAAVRPGPLRVPALAPDENEARERLLDTVAVRPTGPDEQRLRRRLLAALSGS